MTPEQRAALASSAEALAPASTRRPEDEVCLVRVATLTCGLELGHEGTDNGDHYDPWKRRAFRVLPSL